MAIVQNSITGRTKGKVGGLVFTTQFGKNVMKSKPVSVAQPNNDNQKMRKSAMSQVTALARSILSVIQLTFKSQAVGKSAYNVFSSVNLKGAFSYATPPTALLTPEDLVTSKGTIAPTTIDNASFDPASNEILVDFPSFITGAGQSLSDKAVLCAMNDVNKELIGIVSTSTRGQGSATLTTPLNWLTGHDVHCYLSFVNASGTASSDSVYMLAVEQ